LKVVVSPLPILNVDQLMIALWLDWLIVTEPEPWPWIVALPPTTVPPLGPPAIAKPAPASTSAVLESISMR
jgi:hypothetical protein